MKVLGRLAMAAAMLVPVGVALGTPAGAVPAPKAVCHNAAAAVGTLKSTPGFKLTVPQKQSYAVSSGTTAMTCTGGTVTSAKLTLATGEPIAVNCHTVIGKPSNSGSSHGTLVWNTGNGQSAIHAYITIVSTSAHTTTATLKGTINTSPANILFHGHKISGTITLNKGLKTVASGGDCLQTVNLSNFGITAISLTVAA